MEVVHIPGIYYSFSAEVECIDGNNESVFLNLPRFSANSFTMACAIAEKAALSNSKTEMIISIKIVYLPPVNKTVMG